MVGACGDGSDAAQSATNAAAPTRAEGAVVIVSDGNRTGTVRVEFASTPLERQTGLMHRESLDEDAGMLFVFPSDVQTGFWMENTLIPLDIAHIAADGTVLEINTREPLDKTILPPAQPYRYTLEVNGGWFERHGLGVGAKVTLPEDMPAAE